MGLISLDIDGHAMLSQPVLITGAISGGLSKPYVDVEGPGRLPLVQHAELIGEGFEMPVLPPEVRASTYRSGSGQWTAHRPP